MTRKKVNLAYIAKDTERKASFKKRKRGLIKKVSELSTLCDVEACIIIYSPYKTQPTVWPPREAALAVIERFQAVPEMERARKMINHETFTRLRIAKLWDQYQRLQKDNKRTELEFFMHQRPIKDFNVHDAAEMTWIINNTLREIDARMEALRSHGELAAAGAPVGPSVPPAAVQDAGLEAEMESFPWNLVESPSRGYEFGWNGGY